MNLYRIRSNGTIVILQCVSVTFLFGIDNQIFFAQRKRINSNEYFYAY